MRDFHGVLCQLVYLLGNNHCEGGQPRYLRVEKELSTSVPPSSFWLRQQGDQLLQVPSALASLLWWLHLPTVGWNKPFSLKLRLSGVLSQYQNNSRETHRHSRENWLTQEKVSCFKFHENYHCFPLWKIPLGEWKHKLKFGENIFQIALEAKSLSLHGKNHWAFLLWAWMS